MSLLDHILGKPLASTDEEGQKIGVAAGIPVLGLDGLSSAAYGPEAALAILVPLGMVGIRYIVPISAVILALLGILYLSYRQTIAAYPQGGGSYTVARENLGVRAGLLAAAALMVDYILNVAVGISAGIGALVSAVPAMHAHILLLCLVTLALITLVNLRGLRESGIAFGLPTYLFAGTLLIAIAIGLFKALSEHGHLAPVVPPPPLPAAAAGVTLWLLMRSFASGCTAMTGVEAVSNAVGAFREPAVKNAQRTLTAIVVLLALLLAGIAFLSRAYGIGAMNQADPAYQSVLSQMVAAVMGRGAFYYVTIAAVLAVLALSANTSFAGFPRLCRLVAEDNFLPHSFANVGRRLVFSNGIAVLAALSAGILIIFGGITDRLIPLFAVGAFGAFTLSQMGMVVHWMRHRARGSGLSMLVNGVGAAATAAALAVILVAKFVEGAWMTVVLIPVILAIFLAVRRHYDYVQRRIRCGHPLDLRNLTQPIVIVPVSEWTNVTERAVRFAMRLSTEVIAVHVAVRVDEDIAALRAKWHWAVEGPASQIDLAPPRLAILPSPYRRLFIPLLDFVGDVRARHPDRVIAVIIPELVETHWWENLLHNHRATVLKGLLLLRGGQRVVVINVPWYLDDTLAAQAVAVARPAAAGSVDASTPGSR